MEYVYAAMLLHKAGKKINEKNLSKVLTASGIKVETVKIKALIVSLAEVDIDEAIKSAPTMMAAPAATAAPAEETKPAGEDKKKKEEEEKAKGDAALEGLGALFG